MYLYNRHGNVERMSILFYAQKVVGRLTEPNADLLKEVEGWVGPLADNVGEVFGAAVAPLGSPFVAEMLSIAEPKERNG